jgi:hypothetical protein
MREKKKGKKSSRYEKCCFELEILLITQVLVPENLVKFASALINLG